MQEKRKELLMQCSCCKEDRKKEDFYGKENCYKCVYHEKMKKLPKRKCKMCKAVLGNRRWVYCGDECAQAGAAILKKNEWTKLVGGEKISWRRPNKPRSYFF